MKWIVETLIVVAIFIALIWGYNMKIKNQTHAYKKQMPALSYVGAINGKYLFQMAFTQKDNILSGTLVNTFEKENKIYGTIDHEGVFFLTEYEEGEKAGVLEGKIIQGFEIKGTWSTPDGEKWFPFYLVRKPE